MQNDNEAKMMEKKRRIKTKMELLPCLSSMSEYLSGMSVLNKFDYLFNVTINDKHLAFGNWNN